MAKIGKSYYECHVTIKLPEFPEPPHNWKAEYLGALNVAVQGLGWKFSVIRDDIALGPGDKAYATTHINAKVPRYVVISRLLTMADNLETLGHNVIRRKVEEVIYDDRSTAIQPGTCEGACVECHLDDYAEPFPFIVFGPKADEQP